MRGVNSGTPLFIVCSPQARVGRTLLARLLLDFFLTEGRPAVGFDFASEPPSLIDFMPDHTAYAHIEDIEGQMALFDRLIVPDGTAKVVDLAPAAFWQFFSLATRIEFVADARHRGIMPIALFVAAPDASSQRAYAELQKGLPDLLLVPVYNEAVGHGYRARQNYPLARPSLQALQISELPYHFYRYLEKPPFSFADFRGARPSAIPAEAHAEVLRWVRRVFVEFRELELRLLLNDVRLSLQEGAG